MTSLKDRRDGVRPLTGPTPRHCDLNAMNDRIADERSILEARFNHVVKRLTDCWGDPEYFELVINDLMYDKRGDRSGWPPDAFFELQFLQQIHNAAYGPTTKHKDVWDVMTPND
ncbi:hypothetical protein Thimo_2703 [Thioflavicoccus mobilis 8321]|uniref:Uncharacterized protein n=1 Tax=Thioflavicoccus mobilis 8321 TaxID=765912 RepID=L0H1F3_9GAMM|nr:hypothetical protein [Thioflavicoccus mobilis]AGA91414.1 hypothetical protein Thimo_2703 [Thioflavicoccus mobilis 8321]